MQFVATDRAPRPAGHYSQAVVHDGLVYVSGQVSIDPATGEKVLGPIEVQTERTLRNLEAVLQAAGSSLDRVLKVTVFIPDIALWGAVNETYGRVFGDHRPARSVVPIRDLAHGYLIEVEAVAVL